MMDDEDRPRRPVTHTVGEALDALSVEEIGDRIALLTREIERLQATRSTKEAARDIAGSIFKF
ncbi:DUF1192 domain-containing protein [Methylobacterium sp. BTF04]|uniref:DUF1192 domain-containing protein n=1 Tax=Methylobacterium sp. BTF04 TaxID=2708300 RepID=UPI0013D7F894|nr:DUF1192 domain-containing protein [Methylobacterium sp. BTF04]NEU13991.1 DUF1192 domain-containing protein [Methylobacterium sp. BTF04]